MNREFYDILSKSSDAIDIEFNEDKFIKFLKYMELIKEWNEKVNITSITEDEEIIKKHFIDSFKIYSFTPVKACTKVLDVGTGGGFPGIPMKIMNPKIEITLLDSLRKRIDVLKDITDKLEIEQIELIHGRAEEFIKKEKRRSYYDLVTSRAVANLRMLSELCLPYVKKGGYFISFKGPSAEEEYNDSKKAIRILGGELIEIRDSNIENSQLDHKLVIIKKIKETPIQYPRIWKNINSKPL
ncbi:16S rRNA (guanine(527)-N(7))-methyltransferase RsmG [Clostridium sp. DL1XJH146]